MLFRSPFRTCSYWIPLPPPTQVIPTGDVPPTVRVDEISACGGWPPRARARESRLLLDQVDPALYGRYGWRPVRSIPYDVAAYGEPSEALRRAWRVEGWREGDPYPDVVYMERDRTARLDSAPESSPSRTTDAAATPARSSLQRTTPPGHGAGTARGPSPGPGSCPPPPRGEGGRPGLVPPGGKPSRPAHHASTSSVTFFAARRHDPPWLCILVGGSKRCQMVQTPQICVGTDVGTNPGLKI